MKKNLKRYLNQNIILFTRIVCQIQNLIIRIKNYYNSNSISTSGQCKKVFLI